MPAYFRNLDAWSDFWGKEDTRQPSVDEMLSANTKARREGRPYPYSEDDIWGRDAAVAAKLAGVSQ